MSTPSLSSRFVLAPIILDSLLNSTKPRDKEKATVLGVTTDSRPLLLPQVCFSPSARQHFDHYRAHL